MLVKRSLSILLLINSIFLAGLQIQAKNNNKNFIKGGNSIQLPTLSHTKFSTHKAKLNTNLLPKPPTDTLLTKKGFLMINFVYVGYNNFRTYIPALNHVQNSRTGHFGLGLGLDYYYAKNRFWGLGVMIHSDYEGLLPLAASSAHTAEGYTSYFSYYAYLSHHHNINKFKLGYGLSIGGANYRYLDEERDSSGARKEIKDRYAQYGMMFTLHYQLKTPLSIAAIYRPSFFIEAETKENQYEHVISLALFWSFDLKKTK